MARRKENLPEMARKHTGLYVLLLLFTGFSAGITSAEYLRATDQAIFGIFKTAPQVDLNATVAEKIFNIAYPVYIADDKFNIIFCNKAFMNFIGVDAKQVLGRSISRIVDILSPFVLDSERDTFLKTQKELESLAYSGKLPTGDAFHTLDYSNHPNIAVRGKYRVRIHIDSINYRVGDKHAAIFGVIVPEVIK